jgi:hypothetical protein
MLPAIPFAHIAYEECSLTQDVEMPPLTALHHDLAPEDAVAYRAAGLRVLAAPDLDLDRVLVATPLASDDDSPLNLQNETQQFEQRTHGFSLSVLLPTR